MAADARRFPGAPATEIVLRVHRSRLPLVLRSLAVTALDDPEPVAGEPDVYRLRVRSMEGAVAMLVGFGAEVDYVAPAELRDRIIAIAEAVGEHHRNPAGGRGAAPAPGRQ
ncbi:WCX domain-containing protein [Nocardia fusca]